MIVLVIPDIHLKTRMFDIASEIMRSGAAERAVSLMDIPDDWGHEADLGLYEDTFDAAIRFQREFPETLWCFGNHDLSYLWMQPESGFSPAAASYGYFKDFEARGEAYRALVLRQNEA